jgi:4-hydroxybenzoate polyprenyltransferase
MMANLCGGLFVLTQLPTPALIATFAILPVAALYPLAKRYTNYPQLVLGFAFNSGVVIGALTLNPMSPNWPLTMAVYGAGIAWTLVYDTVYAYQVAQKLFRILPMIRS